MPGASEITSSLRGAWLLLWREPGAYQHFTQTVGGFWRSFLAIIAIFPMYLLTLTVAPEIRQVDIPGSEVGDTAFFIRNGLALLVEWGAYPALMVFVARLIDRTGRYALYIIAYNWSAILVMAAFALPVILFQFGLASTSLVVLLSFAATVIALYYRWYVARTALEVTGIIALAIVAGDLALGLLINMLFVGI